MRFTVNAAGEWSIPKDPHSTLDYSWDWALWLAPGDSIASYQLLPDTGLTVVSNAIAGAVITAFIAGGGSAGDRLGCTCRITTAQGRVDDRTLYFEIKQR